MENDCEALPGVAYHGVRDNRSTINTKTGYDDDIQCRALQIIVGNTPYAKPVVYSVTGRQTFKTV